MITNSNLAVVVGEIENKMTAQFFGLSTDTKPTADVPNGSVFIEMNTKKVFFFNKASGLWVEFA